MAIYMSSYTNIHFNSAARIRPKRSYRPPEVIFLRFLLYINFQLLENNRKNSRRQDDVSDWPRHLL